MDRNFLMQETEIRNYTARAQRIYQERLADFTLLSVEATSPEDARESVELWCRKMNRMDHGREDSLHQPPIRMVPDSISEIMTLTSEPGCHTAWTSPGGARAAIITILRSGLTQYPQLDGEEQPL